MTRLLYFLLMLSVLFDVNAQSFQCNLYATTKKDFGPIKKGQEVLITSVGPEAVKFVGDVVHIKDVSLAQDGGQIYYCLTIDNQKIPLTQKKPDETFDFKINNIQDLWDAQIINNVLYNLRDRGLQNSLRVEMEQDALEYVNNLRANNLVLQDSYLELYIYSIISRFVPENIIDGRPGDVNLVIVQDPSINAGMFPNGTMVINTGLLARIHTEDELAAIIAHEIAHFLLDHSVINVNKATVRKKRAEFWGAVLTGITAGVEAYAASQNQYYVPGGATMSVALASQAIAEQINERLGMQFNHEQEYEADAVAVEMLKILGYDSNALASVFGRIIFEQTQERSNVSYFDSYDHPAINKRIRRIGDSSLMVNNAEYEKMVSFAVTSIAQMKFQDGRFRQALVLTSQNIKNGVATSDDYIINANCLMALYNTPEKNAEAMSMILKAKEIDSGNINVYKVEILCNLRLGNKVEANSQLNQYITSLTNIIDNSRIEYEVNYAIAERIWANNVISKLRGL